ncbi:MAG: YbjN domain-containing protein [Simkaniaceae bacterium]|nr:YbjN domain-containing protein [Simkaniaceae bacterium]
MYLRLSAIEQFLIDSGYDAKLQLKDENFPSDIIFIMIGQDHTGRDLTLQLYLTTEQVTQDKGGVVSYSFLNFVTPFPYECTEARFGDLARLCSLINKTALFPGFKLSETDKCAVFHYVRFEFGAEINNCALDFLVATIVQLVHIFAESIENVTSGANTFQEVVSEANSITKKELSDL